MNVSPPSLPRHRSWLCQIGLLTGPLLFLAWATPGVRGAIFDYSAPFQNISAQASGAAVLLSVVDGQGILRSKSVPSGPSFDRLTVHGIAAWSSGSTIHYYVYDPAKTNWVGQGDTVGQTFDLFTAQGVVTWSSGSTVHYRVYDWLRGAWRTGSAVSGTANGLRAAAGIVAWSSPNGIYLRVYDVIAGNWAGANGPGPGLDLINRDGVVAWTAGSFVHYYTYDPAQVSWRNGSQAGTTFDLQTADGVVAWSVNPNVFLRVYDPVQGQWMASGVNSGYTTDLAILFSTVSWSSASGFFTRGYQPSTRTWTESPAGAQAHFAVSATAGNAPLLLAFVDLSLGGGTASWNFGDGLGTSTQRSPYYRYTTFGRYTASLTVAGSSATRVIVTDTIPPTGTNSINGGAAIATNAAVTLTLRATDNSGVVSDMRLGNDGSTWTAWEPYATNRAWTLASGDGLKTAHAQFRDVAGNTSSTATASIRLDTNAPPQARFINQTVNESAGTATVLVQLDHSSLQSVSLRYATADGTANAGTDYTARDGLLVFAPGVTSLAFTVPILPDAHVEVNETVSLNFSSPTNVVLGPPGTLTIADDELTTVFLAETNWSALEGSGALTITVQLSAASGRTVTVGYGVSTNAAGGTATPWVDYTPAQGTLVFAPGQTSQTFAIPVLDDALDEVSETATVFLTGVTNALLRQPDHGRLTILDDDKPVVNFSSAVYEALENSALVPVSVWLSKPFGQEVRVNYSIAGGTASAGSDYIGLNGTLSFFPGTTNAEVLVNLINDTTSEADETVQVRLVNVSGATLGAQAEAEVRVLDDDRGPRLVSAEMGADGHFRAIAWGALGQRFQVESSSNLRAWSLVTTLTNTTGTMEFRDPTPAGSPQRFYRTRLPTP